MDKRALLNLARREVIDLRHTMNVVGQLSRSALHSLAALDHCVETIDQNNGDSQSPQYIQGCVDQAWSTLDAMLRGEL